MNMIRKNGGFTLIELIVVIAILAVVGGIGTVGYSAYVDRANWSADQTMIHDIEQALILGTYTNNYAPNSTVGAVGVSKDAAATASDAAIAAMMEDAFGANWQETLQLQSDKLEGSDASNVLSAMNSVKKEYIEAVPDSSFYAQGETSTKDLAAKVDAVAGAFMQVIGKDNNYVFSSFWSEDFKEKVNNAGLDIKNGQTAANLTVMSAANSISKGSAEAQAAWIKKWKGQELSDSEKQAISSVDGSVAGLVMDYAKYVSIVSYVNNPANKVDDEYKSVVNDNYNFLVSELGKIQATGEKSAPQQFIDLLNNFENSTLKNGGNNMGFYDDWREKMAETDAEAFIASMAAVNSLEGTYVNKDKANMLSQANAFTEFRAADILDTMVSYASLGNVLPNADWVITVVTDNNGVPQIAPELPEG